MSTGYLKQVFGGNLKRLRLSSQRSQAEAAALLGVKQADYWRWESGSVLPRSDRLQSIARAFNTTTTALLSGDADLITLEESALPWPTSAHRARAAEQAKRCGMSLEAFTVECVGRYGEEVAKLFQPPTATKLLKKAKEQ